MRHHRIGARGLQSSLGCKISAKKPRLAPPAVPTSHNNSQQFCAQDQPTNGSLPSWRDGVPVDIDLNATALIAVDMQNDFATRTAGLRKKGIDISPLAAVIPAIDVLVANTRVAGLPVIWLNWGVRADRANLPPLFVEKSARNLPTHSDPAPSGRGRILCAKGDWGAAIVDGLSVEATDINVYKHRFSGFWDNELDSISASARHLHATVRRRQHRPLCFSRLYKMRAFLGYDCMLVDDSCATVSPVTCATPFSFSFANCMALLRQVAPSSTAAQMRGAGVPAKSDNRSAS